MFSDRYYVAEKYSLLTYEHLSTIEKMPYRYTSLADSTYLPVLDDALKNKLSLPLRWKSPVRQTAEMDSSPDWGKYVLIEYTDSEVINYVDLISIPWSAFHGTGKLQQHKWNHFIGYTQLEEIRDLKPKIEAMTDQTQINMTSLNSIKLDPEGNFVSVLIHDDAYNLADLEIGVKVEELHYFAKHRPYSVKGSIEMMHDGGYIYHMYLLYADDIEPNYKGKTVSRQVKGVHGGLSVRYADAMLEAGLLTQEQRDFVETKSTHDTRCDYRWKLSDTGEVEDIYLIFTHVEEFDDLTQDN